MNVKAESVLYIGLSGCGCERETDCDGLSGGRKGKKNMGSNLASRREKHEATQECVAIAPCFGSFVREAVG